LDEGKYTTALPLLQHSLEILQAKPAPEHESKLAKRFDASDFINLDRELAQAYAGAGKDAEAEEMYKRIISMDEAHNTRGKASDEMTLTDDLRGLSGVYRHEHRYDEALETIKRSEAVDDEITNSKFAKSKTNSDAPGVSIFFWLSQIELAEIYREKGDSAAAEPLFQSSLEMTQHMHLGKDTPSWLRCWTTTQLCFATPENMTKPKLCTNVRWRLGRNGCIRRTRMLPKLLRTTLCCCGKRIVRLKLNRWKRARP
jgi:tetratricopeptide (TPR) repeat protein